MKELERKISKSERIVAKAKFSYWVFVQDLLITALLGGLLAVVWVFNQQIEGLITKNLTSVQYLTDQNLKWALLAVGAFCLLIFVLHSFVISRKELVLTENKLAFKWGVINVKSLSIPVAEIKIVESQQNIFQRLLGYGNVIVISDAEKPYKIKHITKPERLADKIMKQTTQMKNRDSLKTIQLSLGMPKIK